MTKKSVNFDIFVSKLFSFDKYCNISTNYWLDPVTKTVGLHDFAMFFLKNKINIIKYQLNKNRIKQKKKKKKK